MLGSERNPDIVSCFKDACIAYDVHLGAGWYRGVECGAPMCEAAGSSGCRTQCQAAASCENIMHLTSTGVICNHSVDAATLMCPALHVSCAAS